MRQLPAGPAYAVEVRNRQLITVDYGAVLRETGVGHCAVVYPRMPGIETQVRVIRATKPAFMIGRWMLRPGLSYKKAVERYRPFEQLAEPDPANRQGIVHLLQAALEDDVPALVIVNNKAEGCAPDSIAALAQAFISE